MNTTDSILYLSLPKSVRVIVHPIVFFNVLDHFLRRDADQDRIVGTLLGNVTSSGSLIEITNCFAVPHSDNASEKGFLDMGYHHDMMQLHEKTNPGEQVIGLYTTGKSIDIQLVHYHNLYAKETQYSPILLTIDTDLRNKESMDLAAYISHSLTFSENPDTSLGSNFERLDLSLAALDTTNLGLDLLLQPSPTLGAPQSSLLSDLASLRGNFHRVLELLDDVIHYVDDVVLGNVPADPKIGRFLEQTVSALPQINPEGFHQMFNNSLQDILMVVYLANLTRTQLALHERHRQISAQSPSSSLI